MSQSPKLTPKEWVMGCFAIWIGFCVILGLLSFLADAFLPKSKEPLVSMTPVPQATPETESEKAARKKREEAYWADFEKRRKTEEKNDKLVKEQQIKKDEEQKAAEIKRVAVEAKKKKSEAIPAFTFRSAERFDTTTGTKRLSVRVEVSESLSDNEVIQVMDACLKESKRAAPWLDVVGVFVELPGTTSGAVGYAHYSSDGDWSIEKQSKPVEEWSITHHLNNLEMRKLLKESRSSD